MVLPVVRVYGGSMVSGKTPPNSSPAAAAVALDQVGTKAEFGQHLTLARERAGLSLGAVQRAATRLRSGKTTRLVDLPRSTVSNMCTGKTLPEPETLRTFLLVCGIPEDEIAVWHQARDRVNDAGRRPDGAVRVRDSDARHLGVHPAIQVRNGMDDVPAYVPRDCDTAVRAALTEARAMGGMVLLTGDSSTGKTRTLFEAVRDVMPGWWILLPKTPAEVEAIKRLPARSTVVWLDELQLFLDAGLHAGTVRALISAGVVVAATLWPDEYTTRSVPRVPGRPDPYADNRELLKLARTIGVPSVFTSAEWNRAQQLADHDPRLQIALDSTDAGVTQVLAAGPALVLRWEQAGDHYGRAVITAALDARRAGARSVLTPQYLEQAAVAYLDSRQLADAPADWFAGALAYATTRLQGAAACLAPHATNIGRVDGYRVADYLHQHATRARRAVPVPAAVWHALVTHHRGDTATLAGSAKRRGQPAVAEQFYRRALAVGAVGAERDLAKHLAGQGRIAEVESMLGSRAETDGDVARLLAHLLAEHNRVDAAITLLKSPVLRGDVASQRTLSTLLVRAGRTAEADDMLQSGDAADPASDFDRTTLWRVDALAEAGRVDEAIALLRAVTSTAGSPLVWSQLAELLAEHDRLEELEELAAEGPARHCCAGCGNPVEDGYDPGREAAARFAATLVQKTLARRGDVVRLRALIAAGDADAARWLARALADQGDVKELRERASHGDRHAAIHLARCLAKDPLQIREALDILRPLADAGDDEAAEEIPFLLEALGDVEEAVSLLSALVRKESDFVLFGPGRLGGALIDLCARHDRVDDLRRMSDSGNPYAAQRLVGLLVDSRRLDELRGEVAAGTPGAVQQLARLGHLTM
jgi:tetratricopeptide (TPR) repeat protein